jgi:hypothetical protein
MVISKGLSCGSKCLRWADPALLLQILVNWVFFQVSIAVLLDNFLTASESMKAEEYKRTIREKQMAKHIKNPLDPLILRLSKDYISDADLSTRLDELFKVPLFREGILQLVFILRLRCARN